LAFALRISAPVHLKSLSQVRKEPENEDFTVPRKDRDMLVLSRRTNEEILFPGMNISVKVLAVSPGKVSLGVQAPAEVSIIRAELPNRVTEWGVEPETEEVDSAAVRLRKQNTQLRHRLKAAAADLRLLRRQLQLEMWSDAEETAAKMQSDFRVAKQQ
jgi:carbon storage regulator